MYGLWSGYKGGPNVYKKGNIVYGAFSPNNNDKITLGELIHDWNYEVNYVYNSETTWKYNENLQRHILQFFSEKKPLEELNASEIAEYLLYQRKEKHLSNNTANKHRTHLMTLFEFVFAFVWILTFFTGVPILKNLVALRKICYTL